MNSNMQGIALAVLPIESILGLPHVQMPEPQISDPVLCKVTEHFLKQQSSIVVQRLQTTKWSVFAGHVAAHYELSGIGGRQYLMNRGEVAQCYRNAIDAILNTTRIDHPGGHSYSRRHDAKNKGESPLWVKEYTIG
mmetsp:Transcript_33126/g.105583  ORF Transcript_33126/g.105583 Transcript_33126/m.105583 type:complete len:136 (+) Transcript_33126:373-780(+)